MNLLQRGVHVFVSALELLEAEGRSAGAYVLKIGLLLFSIGGAVVALVSGVLLLLASACVALTSYVSLPASLALVGLSIVALAGGSIWLLMRRAR